MKELERIVKEYKTEHEIHLSLMGVYFTIKSNSRRLLEKLYSYYSGWEAIRDKGENANIIHAVIGQGVFNREKFIDIIRRPGKLVKEACYDADDGRVILKKRTGVVIYLMNNHRYVVGNLMENLNQLVNQINEIYIDYFLDKGYLLLHASSVIDKCGRGVIFCSESGIGKSTVAVALLEQGLKFLSNDRTLIKLDTDGVDLIGVPKKPRVNPGTILTIPSLHCLLSDKEINNCSLMDKEELWNLEEKHDVEVFDLFGPGALALHGRLQTIYLLDWRRNGEGLFIEPVPPDQAVNLLRPNVLNLNSARRQYRDVQTLEPQLSDISRKVEIFRISGGVDVMRLSRELGQIIQNH